MLSYHRPWLIRARYERQHPDTADVDLAVFNRLLAFAWQFDTGGTVPFEILHDLAPRIDVVDRLYEADLLHLECDVAWCGCATAARPGHASIHDFRAIYPPAGV